MGSIGSVKSANIPYIFYIPYIPTITMGRSYVFKYTVFTVK